MTTRNQAGDVLDQGQVPRVRRGCQHQAPSAMRCMQHLHKAGQRQWHALQGLLHCHNRVQRAWRQVAEQHGLAHQPAIRLERDFRGAQSPHNLFEDAQCTTRSVQGRDARPNRAARARDAISRHVKAASVSCAAVAIRHQVAVFLSQAGPVHQRVCFRVKGRSSRQGQKLTLVQLDQLLECTQAPSWRIRLRQWVARVHDKSALEQRPLTDLSQNKEQLLDFADGIVARRVAGNHNAIHLGCTYNQLNGLSHHRVMTRGEEVPVIGESFADIAEQFCSSNPPHLDMNPVNPRGRHSMQLWANENFQVEWLIGGHWAGRGLTCTLHPALSGKLETGRVPEQHLAKSDEYDK
ncbi:hypothetical protein CAOG_009707 [Capsaspora owczarzaki ATCC 30864]|uniref:Uncharacterized protein n=1 Tax=Capsaspora owczarzaki (strain ATCC 30864) TaxID=595528 RepID=A0A0D2X2N9_CAPO3|nr:hypothetical protein CAOG_009707 [Capsaspora owczarzaki ATCC 30864]